jgi:hypothetical protein
LRNRSSQVRTHLSILYLLHYFSIEPKQKGKWNVSRKIAKVRNCQRWCITRFVYFRCS